MEPTATIFSGKNIKSSYDNTSYDDCGTFNKNQNQKNSLLMYSLVKKQIYLIRL